MKHKKSEHIATVKECRNASSDSSESCSYGEQTCWFHHDKTVVNNELDNNKNEEVIENIFKMMEKYTLRIIDLENLIKTK